MSAEEARAAARAFAAVRSSKPPVETRAEWMTPGASSIRKPSWIRVQSFADPPPPSQPASKPSRPSMAAVAMPSTPPPRSLRPSMLPPASSRHGAAIIQSAREVELESEVGTLHAELARVSDEAEHMRTRVMEESEPQVIALAVAIARRVVARELATDPALIQHWIKEAMGTLPEGAVYVASNVLPEDGQTVDAALADNTAEIRQGASAVAVGAEPRVAALADALGVDSP